MTSGSTGEHSDFTVEAVAQPILLAFQVKACLQIQPESFRRSEEARQAQGRVGRDGTLSPYDLVDPAGRDANVLSQPILADAERTQELFEQYLARMDGWQSQSRHVDSSVVVCNFNIASVAVFPVEAESPLIVHANAVLTVAIAAQFFQAIPRRHAQVVERLCCVQQQQLAQSRSLYGTRDLFDRLPAEEPFGFLVTKTPNHLASS